MGMLVNKHALKLAIVAEAQRLGFTRVGVTTAEPPPHLPEYDRWLANGYHGELGYLASERNRARRHTPRALLPTARSVIVLLTNYAPSASSTPTDDLPRGRVAAYAVNDDYHDVLVARLQALVAFIEAEVGHAIEQRHYTDTGPILERELAQRAGLGWIGMNSLLINPEIGSYTLIAELFTNLDLPPDDPFESDRCGSCTRCITACPTDAILPDRVIDARACISYHTIELKGAIPSDYRAGIGEWVFGCDICQQVCPWNLRFAEATSDPAFAPRPPLPNPSLIELLALSEEDFRVLFRGSPLKRTKRRGLLRNAAVALGNSGDARAIPALIHALADAEPLVRGHAAWALGQLGGADARHALQMALLSENDPAVRAEIEVALGGG